MYQHFVDMASYELDMLKRFDLACHLDGMPLQFMVKVRPHGVQRVQGFGVQGLGFSCDVST